MKVRVFDSVGSESSSSWKLVGREPAAGGEGEVLRVVRACESLTTTIWPRLRFVNVQVTVSPGATSMFDSGLPSSQVALVWSQPLGHGLGDRVAGAGRHVVEGARVGQRAVGVVVELEARGREPAAGREGEVLRVVRARASLTTTICPRLVFVKVQVTVSPGATSMFDTGLPSSQVALDWSQPLGTRLRDASSPTRAARW